MLDFEVLIKLGLKTAQEPILFWEIIGISLFGFAFCKGLPVCNRSHGYQTLTIESDGTAFIQGLLNQNCSFYNCLQAV